jgi:hypothetical protein
MKMTNLISLFKVLLNKKGNTTEPKMPKNDERKFGFPKKPNTGLCGFVQLKKSTPKDCNNP